MLISSCQPFYQTVRWNILWFMTQLFFWEFIFLYFFLEELLCTIKPYKSQQCSKFSQCKYLEMREILKFFVSIVWCWKSCLKTKCRYAWSLKEWIKRQVVMFKCPPTMFTFVFSPEWFWKWSGLINSLLQCLLTYINFVTSMMS